ncbi:MAG: hypothetical protein FJ035_02335, partial [Chloroflexi bacterium]|nr:hypothetical protein [Chloroflexota bacterium]
MSELEWISGGGVTTPAGFRAGSVAAGIKSPDAAAPDRGASTGAAGSFDAGGRDDLALLVADAPCAVAGLFTR